MSDDRQLLRRFTAEHSEAAFGELLTRHLPLVYSAALRQMGGDAHLAQDVAQSVFTDLARKAPGLSEKVVLAGWLHRGTIFAARQILRSENRRRAREQQAVTMNVIQSEPEDHGWQQIRPLLDEALQQLSPADRDALLLRFFEQQSLAQIGTRLGGSEDAARKRIARALEKLRAILQRRGVATTAAVLSATISANAIQAVPVGLAATLTTTSLATIGTGTTLTFLKIMTATQIKLGLGALVAAGVVTTFVIQYQAQKKLSSDNQSLQQQLAQWSNGYSDLSNRVAAAATASQLSDAQLNELARLRGEVDALRRQAGQVAKLQDDNQQLQAELASAPAKPPQLSRDDQYQLHGMHVVDAMKQLALAMRIYEGDHSGQMPTNLDQLIQDGELGSDTNGFNFKYVVGVPDFIGMDNFEFVNVGQVSDSTPDKLLIRERAPRQYPGGGPWQRAYAFADGSVQTIMSNDGNFDNFEAQHSPGAPSQ